jgi:hypothetical protein
VCCGFSLGYAPEALLAEPIRNSPAGTKTITMLSCGRSRVSTATGAMVGIGVGVGEGVGGAVGVTVGLGMVGAG